MEQQKYKYDYYELLSKNADEVWRLLNKYEVSNKEGLQNSVIEAYKIHGDKFALDLIDLFAKKETKQEWNNYNIGDNPTINFTPLSPSEYHKQRTANAINGTPGATGNAGSFWTQLSGISQTVFDVLGGAVGVFGQFNKANNAVKLEEFRINAEMRAKEERRKQITTIVISVIAVILLIVLAFVFFKRKK